MAPGWRPDIDDGSAPLYMQIVEALRSDIASGKLIPGDKLPPHRELARQMGVNVGTVARAYTIARDEGLLSAGIGRGTFVSESASPAQLRARLAEAPELLDLANISISTDWGLETMRSAFTRFVEQSHGADFDGLVPHAGLPAHRRSLAGWLRDRAGIEAEIAQIALTAGGQHAFLVALSALAGESGVVLAERYCYPGFIAAAEMLGLRVQAVEGDEDGLFPDRLVQRAAQTGAKMVYVMPTLHSARPLVMPERRRREIAAAARKADLTILEDGVFEPLLMGEGPAPIHTRAPERTVYLTAFEKILPSTLQVGALVVPERLLPRMLGAIRGSLWGASPLVTGMLAALLDSGEALEILRRSQFEVRRRRELLLEVVQPHAQVLSHPAAYHAWVTLPPVRHPVDIAAAARSVQVRVVTARTFAIAPDAEDVRSFRVSLVRAPDASQFGRALQRLMAAIGAPTRPELSVA